MQYQSNPKVPQQSQIKPLKASQLRPEAPMWRSWQKPAIVIQTWWRVRRTQQKPHQSPELSPQRGPTGQGFVRCQNQGLEAGATIDHMEGGSRKIATQLLNMDWVDTDIEMMDRLLIKNKPAEAWVERILILPREYSTVSCSIANAKYHASRERRKKVKHYLRSTLARWKQQIHRQCTSRLGAHLRRRTGTSPS